MDGAIVIDTPEGIEAYRLLALKGALKLEARGLRFKGGRVSAAQAVREAMGVTTRNKAKLLEEYEAWLRERSLLQ
jgi:hypothetical protein